MRIAPNPASKTKRADYERDALHVHWVDASTFATNLSAARRTVAQFADPHTHRLAVTLSDWEIRTSDVVDLFHQTVENMQAAGYGPPAYYQSADKLGYSQFFAVWQRKGLFRQLGIRDGNDNDSINWTVEPSTTAMRESSIKVSRESLLSGLGKTFKRSKTIYPHIEIYSVCLPDCD